jgi:predicted deacylase
MTIKICSYDALLPGPTLLVIGAVHGNEQCGTRAILRLQQALDDGQIHLKQGRLLLMPIANPKAYERHVRFIERNLNRHLYPKAQPQAYEDFLDPILCYWIKQADVVLDLHSYTSPGGAFIFLGEDNGAERDFAMSLGVDDFVYGWQQAYGAPTLDAVAADQAHKESTGTTEYARQQGAIAITLECGQHLNADAADIGYRAILNALAYLKMRDDAVIVRSTAPRCVRMLSVFYRPEQAHFVQPWRHFDAVKAGEVIANLADGSELTAPQEGYIVLPKIEVTTGGEWFYFGVADDRSLLGH